MIAPSEATEMAFSPKRQRLPQPTEGLSPERMRSDTGLLIVRAIKDSQKSILLESALETGKRVDPFLLIRLSRAMRDFQDCIEVDPARAGGRPVLKDTRFKLSQVLAQLADGDSIEDLVENLDLDGESIRCALNSMSAFLDRPLAH